MQGYDTFDDNIAVQGRKTEGYNCFVSLKCYLRTKIMGFILVHQNYRLLFLKYFFSLKKLYFIGIT